MLADIPGLIEGASEGKGLGIQFLRHIERTRVVVHLLAADAGEPAEIYKNYLAVRAELKQYGGQVEVKKELVILNKTDLLDGEKVGKIIKFLAKKKIGVLPISCGTLAGIELFKELCSWFSRNLAFLGFDGAADRTILGWVEPFIGVEGLFAGGKDELIMAVWPN